MLIVEGYKILFIRMVKGGNILFTISMKVDISTYLSLSAHSQIAESLMSIGLWYPHFLWVSCYQSLFGSQCSIHSNDDPRSATFVVLLLQFIFHVNEIF